jgi:hypothetical protein
MTLGGNYGTVQRETHTRNRWSFGHGHTGHADNRRTHSAYNKSSSEPACQGGQKLEQRRSDNALRHELLSDMTEAASALYLAAQRYSRAKRDKSSLAQQELSDARKALSEQYHKSRTLGEILESRLSAYFEASEPQETWHKVMDLLTVRYFSGY